jgi:hypothetical protein
MDCNFFFSSLETDYLQCNCYRQNCNHDSIHKRNNICEKCFDEHCNVVDKYAITVTNNKNRNEDSDDDDIDF